MRTTGSFLRPRVAPVLYAVVLGLGWTAVVFVLMLLTLRQEQAETFLDARDQIRGALRRDVLFREWAGAQEGVYVKPRRPMGAPSTVPASTAGLELVRADQLTRNIHELASRRHGVQARLTSLSPLRPENRAAGWEATALAALADGAVEWSGAAEVGGQPCVCVMLPLRAEASCLPCHSGARVGDLLGGLGEAAAASLAEATAEPVRRLVLETHGLIWILGLLGLVAATKRLRRDFREAEAASEERHRLEAKVAHLDKLDSFAQMAGGIAHDFNNLLTVIMGNTSLAQIQVPAESPVRGRLTEVLTASRRAAQLAGQMLACSGRGSVAQRPLDVAATLGEMRSLLSALAPSAVKITFDVPAGLPSVVADVKQLRQLVIDLVTNASEALVDGQGEIRVALRQTQCDRTFLASTYADDGLPAGNYLCLEVHDSGCGIPTEHLGKIFDPFFSTKMVGRGLGLAAVLGIVRSHGGAIAVQSAPRSGSTFRVYLPAAPVAGEVAAGGAPAAPAERGEGTVLVVDDEESVVRLAHLVLEAEGFKVLRARDGVEAVDVFRANLGRVDVVLLDVAMPRMDGAEAFRRIRALDPSAPVVMSSGYTEESVQELLSGGGAWFLRKPWEGPDLLDMVRRVKRPAPKA